MQVEMWSFDRIKPYQNNPRLNDEAVDPVVQSIREFGFRQPIVVDTDGGIIVGHTRWKAANKLGLAEVPVHVAKDMQPEAVRAYRIADNRTGENAQWDFDLLPIEIGALQDSGFDCGLLGFNTDELRYFCESYFSLTFHLDWSSDHLKVIAKIEEAASCRPSNNPR